MTWAVSQSAPIRAVEVMGTLHLSDKGYSSGGFMANMNVHEKIIAGTQQQWFARNSNMTGWEDGGFNIVLVGMENAPPSHCSDQGGVPYTTVDTTPVIAEKPYIAKTG